MSSAAWVFLVVATSVPYLTSAQGAEAPSLPAPQEDAVASEPDDAPARGADPQAPATHEVQRGDTLWNISQKYFEEPWRWPKIWALNPDIANPHWIFPGQTLRLRDAGAKEPAPGDDAKEVTATTGTVNVAGPAAATRVKSGLAESPDVRQLGFVDEGALGAAGTINGSIEEKILLATGDHAYVEFPRDHPPRSGERYSIYQVDAEHPLREPGSGVILGYLVHVFGEVVIDSFTDRPIVNGRLLDLVEPVERGYRVGPRVRQFRTVSARTNETTIAARIVAAVEPNTMIARQMFVVLNRGLRHGVAVGNRFVVLRQGDGIKRVMEDWGAMDYRFPPHAIAEIVTIDVQNESSVGWVSRSSRELRVGDVADMHRGY